MRTVFALLLMLCTAAPALAGSFRTYHPDQNYFALGMQAFERQRYGEAADYFRRAARYGDKPSQLALAMMSRDGVGVSRDAAAAYAWADLAAERGYPQFLQVREAIWGELAPADQQRALEVGEALYADYGDDVAKPRLETLLRRGLAQKTGSRTGSGTVNPGIIDLSDPAARAAFLGAFLSTPMSHDPGSVFRAFANGAMAAGNAGVNAFSWVAYYDDANWKPQVYWGYRDALWGVGQVIVEPLRKGSEQRSRG